ncbi:hypothetical protein [Dactylosporangium siamense]|uniref:hypothetical protein n=1 Tax=Dactylosporangium siamense TaxID=685454 RepID=UPI002FE93FAF
MTVFVGRTAELAALRRAADQAEGRTRRRSRTAELAALWRAADQAEGRTRRRSRTAELAALRRAGTRRGPDTAPQSDR